MFQDSLNTAVFTTKFVINKKSLITYVSHDEEDGAWQFFSNDEFESFETVVMIVGLGEMLELDSTLVEIGDLPLGYVARRNSKEGPWIKQKRQK